MHLLHSRFKEAHGKREGDILARQACKRIEVACQRVLGAQLLGAGFPFKPTGSLSADLPSPPIPNSPFEFDASPQQTGPCISP